MSSRLSFFARASAEWEAGRLREAFELFRAGSEAGETECFLNLGVFYECGYGCRRSIKRAIELYRRGWLQRRDTAAAMNLADLFAKRGERLRATRWLQKAVDEGDGDAALELAKLLAESKSKQSRAKAKHLLRRVRQSKSATQVTRQEAHELLNGLGDKALPKKSN